MPTRIVFLALLLFAAGCRPQGPRDVLLVARGMTFTLPSDPENGNPLIHVRPGERVRVTLRNDAPGLMHNFEIPVWDIKTDVIRGGRSTSVAFTVPDKAGRYQYICGPHSSMMRGIIEVAPD